MQRQNDRRKVTARQAARKLNCTLSELVFRVTFQMPDSDDPEISRRVYKYSLGVIAEGRKSNGSHPPLCHTKHHARPHMGNRALQ